VSVFLAKGIGGLLRHIFRPARKHGPRPKGRGMIWEGFRTPPKFGFELPGPKGPKFLETRWKH